MKLIIAASVLLGASFSSSASFVHTDYLVEGDQKASLDTSTGIEWLKLPNTSGMSLDEIMQATSRNGELRGWRLPSDEEVTDLMSKLYRNDYRNNGPYFSVGSTRFEKDIIQNYDWYRYMGTNHRYSYTYDKSKPRAYKSYTYGLTVSDGDSLKRYGYYTEERYYYGSDLTFAASISYDYSQAPGINDSYFLVSDGGVTLSSKGNPDLNQNNPDAPVNDVPVGVLFSGFSLLGLGLLQRRRTK